MVLSADLIRPEPSTQGFTWKSSPMKIWCIPSNPGMCRVDRDTEETDGRAADSLACNVSTKHAVRRCYLLSMTALEVH